MATTLAPRLEYTDSEFFHVYLEEATAHIEYCGEQMVYLDPVACEVDLSTLRLIKIHHHWDNLPNDTKVKFVTAIANLLELTGRDRLAELKDRVPNLVSESFEKTIELSRLSAADMSADPIIADLAKARRNILQTRLQKISEAIDQQWHALRERQDELATMTAIHATISEDPNGIVPEF